MQPPTAPITAWWPATWPATPPTTAPFRHPAACAVPTAVSNVSADIAVTTIRVFICSSRKRVGLGGRPVAGVYVDGPQHYGGVQGLPLSRAASRMRSIAWSWSDEIRHPGVSRVARVPGYVAFRKRLR